MFISSSLGTGFSINQPFQSHFICTLNASTLLHMVLDIDLFDILLLLLIFHAVRKKKKILKLIDIYICILTMYIHVISQDITDIQMLG